MLLRNILLWRVVSHLPLVLDVILSAVWQILPYDLCPPFPKLAVGLHIRQTIT